MKKTQNKKFFKLRNFIMLLFILFILIKIPILLTYRGKLGGDESYEINKIIQLFLEGDIFSFRYYSPPYHYLLYFLQIPFTLPFYLLFPTNEFSSFLGSTFVALVILTSLFLFLKKYFNKKIAILSSLIFIISPLGFTISVLSEDATGNNLILLLFIPFFVLFFNKKIRIRNLSMIFLALLPLFSPYYLILWPCCVVYILLENHFQSKGNAFNFKNLKPYLTIFFVSLIILSPAYFSIFKSVSDRGHFHHELNFSSVMEDKIRSVPIYLTYVKRVFIPFTDEHYFNLSDEKIIIFILYLSFIIYLFLVLTAIIYFIFKTIINKKVKPEFFFAIFPPIYILSEFFFTHRFLGIYNRLISISVHHIKLPIFVSFILISIFASRKKNIRIIFYLFIMINLMINLGVVNSIYENNNFINYNLGNENRVGSLSERGTAKEEILRICENNLDSKDINILKSNSKVQLSLTRGFDAREIDFLPDEEIDYTLYGFGIKLFYKGNDNGLASNLCNFLQEKNKIILCERGYSMGYREFIEYLRKFY